MKTLLEAIESMIRVEKELGNDFVMFKFFDEELVEALKEEGYDAYSIYGGTPHGYAYKWIRVNLSAHYKIVKLTQILSTDSIHVEEVARDSGKASDIIAGVMNRSEFKGKTVAVATIRNDTDDKNYLVAVTTEASPVGDPEQHVFAYACVPCSMNLKNGLQLEKLLNIQL
jgi:hypothetical protein